MKRILFITTTTKREGPGNMLGSLIEHLDRTKFEPIVLTILGGGEWDVRYRELGVRRINFGLRAPLDVVAPLLLLSVIKRVKPDLIHTQLIRADLYGRWAANLTGIPYITSVQNMDRWKRSGSLIARGTTLLDARGLQRAQRVVAVSMAVKKDLTERQGIRPDMIDVIANSVDVARYSRTISQEQRVRVRAALGIPSQAIVVLTTARMVYQKAPEVWLAAARNVLVKHPNVYFVWAGEGPLRHVTQRAIVQLGIQGRVLLLGDRSDIPELLGTADIFVLASRFEGLPLSLIEALCAQKACIATNVSGNPELIQNNQNGLLVPVDDAVSLAQAISRLVSDPALRTRLAGNAAQSVRQDFSASRMTRKYADLYDQLTRATS
jgi:glycosyltransferase involved in cell wall biosynthesis